MRQTHGLAMCVMALAGGVAMGQTTRLVMEASVDGAQTWSSEVAPVPGQVVYFRLRATLVGASTLGFGGMTLQPILTNFDAATDEAQAFTFPGVDAGGVPSAETEYLGRQVSTTPVTNTGRLFPFGAPPQAGMHVPAFHVDAGNVLRIADVRATEATTNVAWGLQCRQNAPNIMGTLFDPSMDVVVFRYAVTFGSVDVVREAWPSIEGGISGPAVAWHVRPDGTGAFSSTSIEMVPARVVPGPGVVAVLGIAGVVGSRRRR